MAVTVTVTEGGGAKKVWYFAYGSNMATATFVGNRGIRPLAKVVAVVPGWRLALSVPGLPYAEPAFASIEQKDSSSSSSSSSSSQPDDDSDNSALPLPDVQGVLYLITQEQYVQVIASEGGGTAYGTVEIAAVPVHDRDRESYGGRIGAFSLHAELRREPCGLASARYMDLIVHGAQEAGLPDDYRGYLASQPSYLAPQTGRAAVGARLFVKLFGPVMAGLEVLTKRTIREDGSAPDWVVILVRGIVLALWIIHDFLFAPVFGRGDGLLLYAREGGNRSNGFNGPNWPNWSNGPNWSNNSSNDDLSALEKANGSDGAARRTV